MENIQNNFKRGAAALVVLAVLKEQDMYGYQLVQRIAEKSRGLFTTQEGSLYPVLYKLEDQGYISGYRVKSGKRMTRVYYKLEPDGLAALEKLENDYRNITEGILLILNTEDGHEQKQP